MSVVVLSCGRTGTNVALEILRGHSKLKASADVENKKLVKPVRKYSDNYLTKCDTIYFNSDEINELLNINPNMKVIWTIRDPRDVMLSKIFRGQPNTEGRGSWVSADGTPKTAKESMEDMLSKYESIVNEFSERVMLVRMEDMLLETEMTARGMCDFLGLEFEKNMTTFPLRMRNKHKVRRYGGKIHTSQINLWKSVDEVYDGFFKKQTYKIKDKFDDLTHLISFFGYGC